MELSKEELMYRIFELKHKYSNYLDIVMILTDCQEYIESLEDEIDEMEAEVKNLENEMYEYEHRQSL